jgi:hypothetical protein
MAVVASAAAAEPVVVVVRQIFVLQRYYGQLHSLEQVTKQIFVADCLRAGLGVAAAVPFEPPQPLGAAVA